MDTGKLIRDCCKGSIASQKYLFDKYAQAMYLLCRRYMRTNECAEEAVMNGFLQCFRTLVSFTYTNDAAFAAWLKRICINECLQMLRKSSNLAMMSESEVELSHHAEVETALDNLSAAEIYKLIDRLPTGYKTVFNLYAVEGYTHKEIAGMLHIAEGTSKSQLSKAKSMLQQMIQVNYKIVVANG